MLTRKQKTKKTLTARQVDPVRYKRRLSSKYMVDLTAEEVNTLWNGDRKSEKVNKPTLLERLCALAGVTDAMYSRDNDGIYISITEQWDNEDQWGRIGRQINDRLNGGF